MFYSFDSKMISKKNELLFFNINCVEIKFTCVLLFVLF